MIKKTLEKEIGKVTHFYDRLGVAIVKLTDKLNVGDSLHVFGKHTDFTQVADSLQIEHASVEGAKRGEEIGIKVGQVVHEGDRVFRVGA